MQKESRKRILIVEDDADISMIEEAYLSAAGFETEIITDGIEAEKKLLEQADSRQYDLILLDLMLPGKSGYDICKHVRDKVEQPILMVTARTESLDKIRGLGCGADDYIQKPFDPAELAARVHANIRQYERLRDRFLAQAASDKPEEIVIGDLKILPDSFKAQNPGDYLGRGIPSEPVSTEENFSGNPFRTDSRQKEKEALCGCFMRQDLHFLPGLQQFWQNAESGRQIRMWQQRSAQLSC